jgi:protein required for attachment to host cells
MPGATAAAANRTARRALGGGRRTLRRDEHCLVVVADRGQARLYTIEANDGTRRGSALVERAELANPDPRGLGSSVPGRPRTETNTNRQAGPVHPIGAQRERHRLELERRFAAEIAASAAKLTSTWPRGAVVLIAEPGLLGLAREFMRDAVDPRVELKELARDYAHLTRAELHEQLIAGGLLPEARGSAR